MNSSNRAAGIALAAAMSVAAGMGSAQQAPVSLDQGIAGKVAKVRVGEVVALTLPTAVDGGYDWTMLSAPGVVEAKPRLRVAGGGGAGHAVGGPGKTTFYLKATSKGRHAIKLAEFRPWEKASPPAETFAFTLHASSAR